MKVIVELGLRSPSTQNKHKSSVCAFHCRALGLVSTTERKLLHESRVIFLVFIVGECVCGGDSYILVMSVFTFIKCNQKRRKINLYIKNRYFHKNLPNQGQAETKHCHLSLARFPQLSTRIHLEIKLVLFYSLTIHLRAK